MTLRPRVRRLTVLGGAAALALSLVPGASTPPALAHHAGSSPGPVNAQSTFKWGVPQWQDEFEYSGTKRYWHVSGRGNVRPQHGMLTLNTGRHGDTRALLDRKGHATGRWEIRLRSHRFQTGARNYRVRTELVPARNRDQHCGARNVSLEKYATGGRRAHFYIRNLPGREFSAHKRLDLSNDRWHTFGVEVTHRRISWFVDAHVIRSERRPKALSGVPFTVRFSMDAPRGARMNQSRMQMDWLRYFDLHRPNQKSVKAPPTTRGRYAGAC
ncbi:hypothetical protein ACT8ZV_10500 [Nocardioides sp. MAHUQ-72]|uniref:hypothetical protein n=1 Tax=unclassified Nocardioides TaxID=2615069 RepID=UPI0036113D89